MKDINYWLEEVKDCKKLINKKVVNKKLVGENNSIEELFTKIKNNKQNCENDFKISNYNYKLQKNESLGIDRNIDKKLKKGKINIDLKLDFHGLTLEKAFDSLIYNIEKAYNNKLRCILIVTGKGNGTVEGRDSIKNSISKWMEHPNISSRVIKYTDAQKKDGGTGAIYVLLKRNKNLL